MKTIVVMKMFQALPSEVYVFPDTVKGRDESKKKFMELAGLTKMTEGSFHSEGDDDYLLVESSNDMELF